MCEKVKDAKQDEDVYIDVRGKSMFKSSSKYLTYNGGLYQTVNDRIIQLKP